MDAVISRDPGQGEAGIHRKSGVDGTSQCFILVSHLNPHSEIGARAGRSPVSKD